MATANEGERGEGRGAGEGERGPPVSNKFPPWDYGGWGSLVGAWWWGRFCGGG